MPYKRASCPAFFARRAAPREALTPEGFTTSVDVVQALARHFPSLSVHDVCTMARVRALLARMEGDADMAEVAGAWRVVLANESWLRRHPLRAS